MIYKYNMSDNLKKIKDMINIELYALPQNKLTNVIKYNMSLLTQKDYCLGLIVPILTKNKKSWITSVSIMYGLSSIYTIYDLKHMLNKPTRNGKPNCHVFFGESLSQLSALCTSIEATNILVKQDGDFYNDDLKTKLIKEFYLRRDEDIDIDNDPLYSNIELFINNNSKNYKKIISKNLLEKQKKFITMSLKICLIFFESSMDDKKLEEISEYISQLLLQDISLGKRLQISNKIINLSHDTCLQNNMKELLITLIM
tara:strand:- start:893 stop:1660 length:768 start_codon:yes stop_codon:yes gene_type:complete